MVYIENQIIKAMRGKMTTLSYTLLDVFTRELNLSESVFVTRPSSPTKQKRLRIFTPQVELPMAGHPTIGAAFYPPNSVR
jgi:trans-2,3-dihydro-3-hydroxyanthranilate isomerase